jgi:hypothetical protein
MAKPYNYNVGVASPDEQSCGYLQACLPACDIEIARKLRQEVRRIDAKISKEEAMISRAIEDASLDVKIAGERLRDLETRINKYGERPPEIVSMLLEYLRTRWKAAQNAQDEFDSLKKDLRSELRGAEARHYAFLERVTDRIFETGRLVNRPGDLLSRTPVNSTANPTAPGSESHFAHPAQPEPRPLRSSDVLNSNITTDLSRQSVVKLQKLDADNNTKLSQESLSEAVKIRMSRHECELRNEDGREVSENSLFELYSGTSAASSEDSSER